MDLTEKSLRAELEKTEASLDASQSTAVGYDSKIATEALADREPPKHVILEELDSKKKELVGCPFHELLSASCFIIIEY